MRRDGMSAGKRRLIASTGIRAGARCYGAAKRAMRVPPPTAPSQISSPTSMAPVPRIHVLVGRVADDLLGGQRVGVHARHPRRYPVALAVAHAAEHRALAFGTLAGPPVSSRRGPSAGCPPGSRRPPRISRPARARATGAPPTPCPSRRCSTTGRRPTRGCRLGAGHAAAGHLRPAQPAPPLPHLALGLREVGGREAAAAQRRHGVEADALRRLHAADPGDQRLRSAHVEPEHLHRLAVAVADDIQAYGCRRRRGGSSHRAAGSGPSAGRGTRCTSPYRGVSALRRRGTAPSSYGRACRPGYRWPSSAMLATTTRGVRGTAMQILRADRAADELHVAVRLAARPDPVQRWSASAAHEMSRPSIDACRMRIPPRAPDRALAIIGLDCGNGETSMGNTRNPIVRRGPLHAAGLGAAGGDDRARRAAGRRPAGPRRRPGAIPQLVGVWDGSPRSRPINGPRHAVGRPTTFPC